MSVAYDVYERFGESRANFRGTYEGDEATVIAALIEEGTVADDPEIVREGDAIYLDYDVKLVPNKEA